jgi:nuclease-like protein
MTEQLFPIIIGFVLVAIVACLILAIMRPAARRRYVVQESKSFTPPVQLYQHDPYSPPVTTPLPARYTPQTSMPQVIEGSDYLRHGPWSRSETSQVGAAGEDNVTKAILNVLDERWIMFRNLMLPNSNNGDIDIVLVGPGGIWALEVKTYTGNYIVRNGSYYKESRNGLWYKQKRGPGAQLYENAGALRDYLMLQGITSRNCVKRAVVMAGESNVYVHSTGTTIWRLSDLRNCLHSLNARTYLTQTHVDRVVNVLREVAYSNRTMSVH